MPKLSKLIAAISIGVICFLITPSQSRSEPSKRHPSREFVCSWGPYDVVIDHLSANPDDGLGFAVRVVSPNGKTLRSVTCEYGAGWNASPIRLRRSRADALDISVHPMTTNSAQTTSFIFTRDHGIHNVAVIRGDEVSPSTPSNGDRPVLLSDGSNVFEWAGDLCNACSPFNIAIVYAWNGQYYSEATRRYPQWSRSDAADYLNELATDLRDAGRAVGDARFDEDQSIEADVAGYYGNMALIGRQSLAIRKICRTVPRRIRIWFFRYKSGFDEHVSETHSTGYMSNQQVYNGDADDPWSPFT